MKFKQTICAAAFAAVGFSAQAGEVDDSNITTFQANTPAVAAEVNSTISALITAVNDNAARIVALENAAAEETASVSGRSYTFYEQEAGWRGNPTGRFGQDILYFAQTDLVFNSDSTGTASIDGVDHERTVSGDGLGNLDYTFGVFPLAENINFTWAQVGQVVTIMIPDTGDGPDEVELNMTLDGQLGILMHVDDFDTSSSGGSFGANHNIGIAIRTQ